MDFSKWPEKNLLVTNILLDFLNPRIPPSDEVLDQRALIADLVYHDKIDELARNIANNGFFPIESLIVTKKNNKTIVIEGNRRLAALKLLINPDVAPEDQIPKFRAISNRIDINTIKKVRVIVTPSREAAAPIIMSKHTKPQVASWKPIMKAAFYNRLLQSGISIEDLALEYNVSTTDIITSLRLYNMYKIACSLDLPEEVSKIVRNPREFNATTLQRFYVHKIGLDFLGIEFDDGINIKGKIDINEFTKGFKKIISDIATEEIISRSLDRTKDIQEYIESFSKDEKPDLTKKGKFTTDTLLNIDNENKKASIKSTGRKTTKKTKPKPKGLIPKSVSCDVNNQRIQNIYDELRTLPVAKYPNAVSVLFRSLLEMSLSHYLSITGELSILINEEKEKRTKKGQKFRKDWHPTLSEMLKHLLKPGCKIIKNPNIIKVINKFLSEKNELLSHDSLNYFVHNQFYSPNEESLRRFWNQLEGLFQIILIEA